MSTLFKILDFLASLNGLDFTILFGLVVLMLMVSFLVIRWLIGLFIRFFKKVVYLIVFAILVHDFPQKDKTMRRGQQRKLNVILKAIYEKRKKYFSVENEIRSNTESDTSKPSDGLRYRANRLRIILVKIKFHFVMNAFKQLGFFILYEEEYEGIKIEEIHRITNEKGK